MDGTVRYPFRYCASARCAFFTGRATEVQRRTSMHVRRYPVRPGRRRESVRPRALAEEWTSRVEGGCDMPMARCRDGRRSWLPRPHDRTNFSSWMAGRLLDAVDGNTQTRGTRPTSTTASGAHKYVYVDSTLFVDSELDDKGQSVAVGRPRRALLFARPLLLTYPASIVGSLAMARTSRMYVGASAALCRRKLGG